MYVNCKYIAYYLYFIRYLGSWVVPANPSVVPAPHLYPSAIDMNILTIFDKSAFRPFSSAGKGEDAIYPAEGFRFRVKFYGRVTRSVF